MKMELSNMFEPMERDRYIEQLHSHMNYQSLRTNDIIEIKENNKCLHKHEVSQGPYQIFFQMHEKHCLPQICQGIILIKQNYESLFKSKNLKQLPFHLKQILIKLYAPEIDLNLLKFDQKSQSQKKEQSQEINPLSILIESEKITLFRQNQSQVVSQFQNNSIFPSNFEEKLSFLQRRIWVEINRKINRVSVHTGDLQSIQNGKTIKISEPLDSSFQQHHFDWKHCEKTYQQIQKNETQKEEMQNPLLEMTHFRIFVKLQSIENIQQKNLKKALNPFYNQLSFKILKVQAKRQPQLKQTPNMLEYDLAQISSMPNEVKSLFVRLKELNLLTLCCGKQNSSPELTEELIQNSIHHSLMIKHKLLGDNEIPIGILNHLLKVKTDFEYKNFMDLKLGKKKPSQMYSEITNQRIGYIRFQICCPKGHYPGSPAILQIWPPFNCSPIHNHGQAFGLVKVLMGQIEVENFEQLCLDFGKEPYLKSSFQKGQYTWFSQNSFGIHRIMNLHNQTAITLQGYYDHKEGLDEYFSFIHENPQKKEKSFVEYFPQNDWENYLNKKSIESQEDRDFIDRVIEYYYGLVNKQTIKIDCSYGKFVEVLVKEYNVLKQVIMNS